MSSVPMNPCVLITGAGGQGIGYASAVRFAQEGFTVAITDIVSMEHTKQAVESHGGRCIALHMDVCDSESVKKGKSRVGTPLQS